MSSKPAIFSDRDGTLVKEVNYLSHPDDVQIDESTRDAVLKLKKAGFLLIVVTNQSGIGRGIYQIEDMQKVHEQIQRELNYAVDSFYFCPHVPNFGCECRKPGLGMINNAREDFDIDMSRSWFIGDKVLDIETGESAGISTAMVATGYGLEDKVKLKQPPTIFCENFAEAVSFII